MESPQQEEVKPLTEEESKRLQEIMSKTPVIPDGAVYVTAGARHALPEANDVLFALHRHFRGDWGEVPPEDAKANDESVKSKDQIISAYTASNGVKFWIITDAGHETTTILLPDEY
jgi:hypothetical protein